MEMSQSHRHHHHRAMIIDDLSKTPTTWNIKKSWPCTLQIKFMTNCTMIFRSFSVASATNKSLILPFKVYFTTETSQHLFFQRMGGQICHPGSFEMPTLRTYMWHPISITSPLILGRKQQTTDQKQNGVLSELMIFNHRCWWLVLLTQSLLLCMPDMSVSTNNSSSRIRNRGWWIVHRWAWVTISFAFSSFMAINVISQ